MASRRAFLGGLAATLAAATFDPDRLLWVPGAKTWFLPPVRERMAITSWRGMFWIETDNARIELHPRLPVTLENVGAGQWKYVAVCLPNPTDRPTSLIPTL